MSNKIAGGDWKYFDYYYGVNLTSFNGRFDVNARSKPKTKQEWIKRIQEFPQPSFPFNAKSLNVFHFAKTRVYCLLKQCCARHFGRVVKASAR